MPPIKKATAKVTDAITPAVCRSSFLRTFFGSTIFTFGAVFRSLPEYLYLRSFCHAVPAF
jgi:hypothetical protein